MKYLMEKDIAYFYSNEITEIFCGTKQKTHFCSLSGSSVVFFFFSLTVLWSIMFVKNVGLWAYRNKFWPAEKRDYKGLTYFI